MEEYKAKLKTLSMVAYGSMCFKLGYNNRVIDKVCLIFLDNSLLFSIFINRNGDMKFSRKGKLRPLKLKAVNHFYLGNRTSLLKDKHRISTSLKDMY